MKTEQDYCTLMIIDDEYVMRQGIKHMMEWEKEGFKIIGEATNGKEGLALVDALRPDIVLVDIVMPILDGIEFTALMQQRYPKTRIIILSSYDKFEYVKQALINGASDYILKPSLRPETLLEVLLKTVKSIPNLHLRKDKELSFPEKLNRYLNGYEVDITEHSFREYFSHSRYRLLCANLDVLCGGYKEHEHEIYRIVEKYFQQQTKFKSEVLWIRDEICCVILNYRIKEEDLLWQEVLNCIHMIREYNPQTFWVYSDCFFDYNSLKARYMKVVDYASRRFYHKNEGVCKEENVQISEKVEKFDYATYSNYLKYQEFQSALRMLQEYVELLSGQYIEEYLLKNTTKNLLYNFLIEWERGEKNQSKKKIQYFQKIDNCIYIEDFRDIFAQLINELLKNNNDVAGNEHNIMEMCQFIRQHYMENLELVQLAEQFNYNYHYLSTYFNQQVAEGFSGYLNRIRIDKACELLNATPHTIAQISDIVGYSDHSYFCRVFKNIKGRTPSQWRKKSIIK